MFGCPKFDNFFSKNRFKIETNLPIWVLKLIEIFATSNRFNQLKKYDLSWTLFIELFLHFQRKVDVFEIDSLD